MKLQIFIQGYSDIITNSSSELFCIIESDQIKEIYGFIDRIFGYNQESEITPVVDLVNKHDKIDEYTRWNEYNGEYDDYPNQWIEIDFPYSLRELRGFYEAGLTAILNEKIGENNYKITYN